MGRKKQSIKAAHRHRLQLLGQRLAALRIHRSETITTVAQAVQLTPEVITRIEQGQYPEMGLLLLLRLCEHYGVSADDVLKGWGEE